ncbi:MAG: protein kinase [Planctomycetes bacterium]|nr:protein kinase [Planctomycetota bacterium]
MEGPQGAGSLVKLAPIVADANSPPLVFHAGVYRIGRLPDNDFVLTAPGISDHHCVLRVEAGGALLERADEGAEIQVNGKPLAAGPALSLQTGAWVVLGKKTFRVAIEAEASAGRAEDDESPLLEPDDDLTLGEMPSATGLRAGSVFAGYKLEERIGSGETAEVYRAVTVDTKRKVALKVLKTGVEWEREAVGRLYREARVGGTLSTHPCVITILEAGQADHRSYIAMEYVEGHDLQTLLDRDGPFPVGNAVDVALQVADCLRFARRFQIMHRDINPGNLLLTGSGQAKLLDLGLARVEGAGEDSPMTLPNQPLGTLAFMSPEQALNAAEVDHRTDIYSLGATLFAMVTGVPPIEQRSIVELTKKIVGEKPPTLQSVNPSIPERLSRAVEKCLEKDPVDRYQEYDELIRDLEAVKKEA